MTTTVRPRGAVVVLPAMCAFTLLHVGSAAASTAGAASACTGDLNNDGRVDSADLGILLIGWGAGDSSADLDDDGDVDGADIGIMLLAWGPCFHNEGFESDGGWSNLVIGDSEYHAPVDGDRYAVVAAGAPALMQSLHEETGDSGVVTVTVWARSIYGDDLLDQVRQGTMDAGPTTRAVVELSLSAGGLELGSSTVDVSPAALIGAPAEHAIDDGGNVWIDGDYRMATGPGHLLYQPIGDDPILDPWARQGPGPADFDNAFAPIVTPQGLRAIYGGFYDDTSPSDAESFIDFVTIAGDAPDYEFTIEEPILEHVGSENPWVIDAHLYHDPDTQRLWMTWGGHRIWVTELDPADGRPVSPPVGGGIAFEDFPKGAHTPIMCFAEGPDVGGSNQVPDGWDGDVWSSGYMEGASLYKHDGFYYAFGSYGALDRNYTIRVGRAASPTGPFVDKRGFELTTFHAEIDRYGASMLLGNDGDQLVPGHPHVWAEGGVCYLGYDYRTDLEVPEESAADRMGIRKLSWVDGWPTVWHPVSVAIDLSKPGIPSGETLDLAIRNVGDAGSLLAVDHVTVTTEVN
jgi:hypothetical protein